MLFLAALLLPICAASSLALDQIATVFSDSVQIEQDAHTRRGACALDRRLFACGNARARVITAGANREARSGAVACDRHTAGGRPGSAERQASCVLYSTHTHHISSCRGSLAITLWGVERQRWAADRARHSGNRGRRQGGRWSASGGGWTRGANCGACRGGVRGPQGCCHAAKDTYRGERWPIPQMCLRAQKKSWRHACSSSAL